MREPDLDFMRIQEIGMSMFKHHGYEYDQFKEEFMQLHSTKDQANFIRTKFGRGANYFDKWHFEEKLGVLLLLPGNESVKKRLAELLNIKTPYALYKAYKALWHKYETFRDAHDNYYYQD